MRKLQLRKTNIASMLVQMKSYEVMIIFGVFIFREISSLIISLEILFTV